MPKMRHPRYHAERMRSGGAWVVFVVPILLSSPAFAQDNFGSIRGRVDGPSGSMSGASIELTEIRTGVARATATNEVGAYLFSNVAPGTYRLRVAAPSHKAIQHDDIIVGIHAALLIDVRLELGPMTEQVIVTANAVERANGVLATAFSHRELVEQPTAGRNIFIMSALAPTVLPTGNAIFVRQQDQSNASLISMAGSARRANTYVIDGVPIVDIQNRATIIPGMELVDELRVQLGPYDAETGRTSGGVFNVSARSGTNVWTGTGVYQHRPDVTQAQLFFAEKAGLPRAETSYHLFAGSAGGPIARNRSFFFVSGEGYRTESPRNTVLNLPTEAERRGDFSQSGVTIYDPLTTRPHPSLPGRFIRDAFPGNQIPASRLNPVALAMLTHLPLPAAGKSLPVTATVLDEARQFSGKVTHHWSNRVSTSATYAYYRSAEPDARFFGGALFANGADPGDGALVRRVHFLALNHSWTLGNDSLLQVRYGHNQFLDDNRGADFDLSTLGFDARFVDRVPFRKFPSIGVIDYGQGGTLLGDRDRQRGDFYARAASASFTTLRGDHTLRAGAEYRVTGVDFRNLGGSGAFGFTRDFTSGPDPLSAGASGDAMASFLLGYPAYGSIYTSSPIDVRINHGAAFVQDDVRIGSRLTLNAGLRIEYEDGLREAHNRIGVGWASNTPFPIQVPALRPDGTPLLLTGGLIYAGVNGAPTYQGAADRLHLSPRISLAFAADAGTTVRAGYGIFRAPQQGISASEAGTGTRGYNVTTDLVTTLENRFVPCASCTLTAPFPSGIAQPSGHALGVMTGVGGGIEFVDPATTPGRYQRFSVEIERQLAAHLAVSAAYVGGIGTSLSVGGSSGSFVNINQLDPRYLSMGAALTQPVTNPFFGTPLAVGILAGQQIPAAQLLRPYPQFDAVYAMRSSLARSRYDALIVGVDRRFDRWSLRANYTFSRQRDNQFAESNFFSEGSSIRNYYDIESEFGLSVLDVPHRANVAGSIDLPLGLSASYTGTFQSGFPVAINQGTNNSGLLAGSQRPNVVAGVEPMLTRDPIDAFDRSCMCIRWLNPAAWSEAAAFTLGTAPRTDGHIRTPGRTLVDVAIGRTFRMARQVLTVRTEIINLLNARDFRGPNPYWGTSTFGEIRSDSGFPRTLQLRARLTW